MQRIIDLVDEIKVCTEVGEVLGKWCGFGMCCAGTATATAHSDMSRMRPKFCTAVKMFSFFGIYEMTGYQFQVGATKKMLKLDVRLNFLKFILQDHKTRSQIVHSV
jgi:hypothetical protein